MVTLLSAVFLLWAAALGVETGPDLTGLAAIIVAVTGLLGLVFAQVRRPRNGNGNGNGGLEVTSRVLELVSELEACRDRESELRREITVLRARLDRRNEQR